MKILGIDEAGRGCVIGPMVISGVVVNKNKLALLKNLGVKDSKLLSFNKRQLLANKIVKLVDQFQLVFHSPLEIDKVSLNQLDLQTITDLINHFQPKKVFFDVPVCPNGVDYFVQAVKTRLEIKTNLVGENKADLNYPIVSAASILAKVERDKIISQYQKKFGDFGSGYMSDPKTQQFLSTCFKNHKEFPSIVRKKWQSVKKYLFQQSSLLE